MNKRFRKKGLSICLSASMVLSVAPVNSVVAYEREATKAQDLIISEYLEGSSNNKAVEIYNGTGETIDLSEYTLELYANGANTPNNIHIFEGELAHGETYVLSHASANDEIKSKANIISPATNFNGDDTLLLKKGGEVIDSFGQLGVDPGDSWVSNGVNTKDMTLVRNPDITKGDTDPSDEFDPSLEWIALSKDDVSNLGKHAMSINQGPDVEAPKIEHTPVTEHNLSNNLTINTKLSDDRKIDSAKVYYKTVGDAEYTSANLTKQEDIYTYTISKSELDINGIEYFIEVSDGTNITTAPADKESPYIVVMSEDDITAPVIDKVYPTSGTNTNGNQKPEIGADFSDEKSINRESILLKVDDVDVTDLSTITDTSIRYTPEENLSDGKHIAVLTLSDNAGNETVKEWNFSVGEVNKNLYFGQLHSHTNLSDGQGTLDQAYTHARDEGNLDFFAVTDHSNSFDNDTKASISDGSMSSEWNQGQSAADKYNEDGEFAAIYGYEMTWSGSTGGYGHMNTFNTPGFETRSNSAMNLTKYYETLKTQPQSISMFNHPGKTFGDFNAFAHYDKEIDEVVTLLEVGNGEGEVGSSGYFPSYEEYTKALDKGWHVAPSNNQDNHKGGWGTSNTARTVIESDELNRESVYEALRERRVYATEDNNLEIAYSVNGNTMGSILDEVETLDFEISVNDPDASEKIKTIEIIANGGTVVKTFSGKSNTEEWNFTIPSDYSYYYVRIVQEDGHIAVTSPIWVGETINVGINSVEHDTVVALTGEEVNVTTKIFNNELVDATNVKVEYFLGDEDNKLGEEILGTIASSSTVSSVFKYVPSKAGIHTILARVTMTVDGVERTFVGKTEITVKNESQVSKVVIDASKQNYYVSGYYAGKMTAMENLVAQNGGKPIFNKNDITDETLEGVSLLVLTDPESTSGSTSQPMKYSESELSAIKRYVDRGGNVIITSKADYKDAEKGSDFESSVQGNSVLQAIGSNIRFNDDQMVDEVENGGQSYRLYLDDYNTESSLLKGVDISKTYSFYSGCNIYFEDESNSNIEVVVRGHETTTGQDSDNQGDAKEIKPGEAIGLAVETLDSGAKIIVGGSTFFSDFEIDDANDYTNRKIVQNVLNELAAKPQLPITSISEVRKDEDNNNKPDNYGETFVIEGTVTAGSNTGAPNNSFFDVIYVQDETGGITVFGVSDKDIKVGQKVRVEGIVDEYLGDTELSVSNENLDVTIIDESINPIEPNKMSTERSMLEENEGLLVQVAGNVTRVEGQNIYVSDGSGESRAYIEGYIGSSSGDTTKWSDKIKVGDLISIVGLASEDPEGKRLRVRDTDEIELIDDNNNGNEDDGITEINIFHTNDTHSRVEATYSNDILTNIGYAKFKTYIDDKNKEEKVDGSLLLDAGDTLHGQSFATLEEGDSIAKVMKEVGYDAMAPGNHDFNYGQDRLSELGEIGGFEILAGNVKDSDGELKYGSTMIKEIGDVKVGVFGLATPETEYKTNPNNVSGLDFGDKESVIEDAEKMVKQLEEEGADIVIGLTHLGIDDDSEVKSTDIAKSVDGIDLIIDGHSHSSIDDYEKVEDTIITSAGEHFKNFGMINVKYDQADDKLVEVNTDMITASQLQNVEEDSSVSNLIKTIKDGQGDILNTVIGKTKVKLDGERSSVRYGHTNLGRLLTNSMLYETGADISMTNGGGIRASIDEGDITKGDVLEVLPFGNYIVTIQATGQQIIDALNHGLVVGAGSFTHFAGMDVKVKEISENGTTKYQVVSVIVDGKPLDLEKTYTVATNDFLAVGGDNYTMLKDCKLLNEFAALDEALISYIHDKGEDGINHANESNYLTIVSDNENSGNNGGSSSSGSGGSSQTTTVTEHKLVGTTRYSTAVKISNEGWTSANNVVLVNSSAIADALSATPFSKAKNAPILLTENNKLNSETKAELQRLGAKNIYIIGGTSVVGDSVINELKSMGMTVERISGEDRYQTSLNIAKKLGNVSEIAVVNGDTGLADAVSIAPVAADKNMPIVLSSPKDGTKVFDEYIKEQGIKTSYVIGKEKAISESVANGLPNAKRLGGETRNETNAVILENFYTSKSLSNVYVAKDGMQNQDQLIDALSVGVLAAKDNSPVVIVGSELNTKQQSVLTSKTSKKVTQVGGNGNESVFAKIVNLFKK